MTNLNVTIRTKDGDHIVQVPKGATVMDACHVAEQEIPHFCYHQRLSIAGNCRMCLVEVEGAPKPIASCHFPAADGMVVKTDSELTIEARKGTMEMLLANHPLDCPICDQGGECDLQDQAMAYGSDRSRFDQVKRAVDDKDIGSKIKTVMTRCIHCMRCTRFATEIAGVEEFGATGRGVDTQVGTYVEEALQSELAGNMIDLCPVGALTNKPYAFSARPWELTKTPSIDMTDSTGSHIRVDHRAGKVMRLLPRECDDINEEWLADHARFSFDAFTHNRLLSPMNQTKNGLSEVGWPTIFQKLVPLLKKAKKDKICALAGDLHGAEDYYAFNAFLKQTLGTDHVDARGDGSRVDGVNPAAYICQTPLAQMAEADCILLIGCNPRHEAPLLNVRLRHATKQGATVHTIGDVPDLTYHVNVLGQSPEILLQLLDETHSFAKKLKKAEKPMVIVGAGALARPDGEQILFHSALLAEQFGMMNEDWRGFNVLHWQPGRVSALDMGVHPVAGGFDKSGIEAALAQQHVDVLFLYGDVDIAPELARKAKTLIYVGTHRTALADVADFVLPAAAHTEKAQLLANCEGRVQELVAAVNPPHHAKPDWKIFRALSGELEKPLPFDTLAQLRQQIIDYCPAYGRVGEIVPPEITPVATGHYGAPGDMNLQQPLTYALDVNNFYLSNEFLRNSSIMWRIHEDSCDDMEAAA